MRKKYIYITTTNVYNLNIYAVDYLDVVVSCAPTPKPLMFNGKPADCALNEFYGSSPPLYLGFWTSNDVVKLAAFSRSNDIDLNKMDKLPIEEIVDQCES